MEEGGEELYGESLNKQDDHEISIIKYDKNDFTSGPERVEGGTVPTNIIELYHSHAYDCQRYFNMCVPDPETILFASGSLIHFFNTKTREITFQRGSTGRGIGHITKNPTESHIAVGENGTWPPIIIYEWPSMEIVTVLQKGATKSYSHLAYSPDGKLLVSQGGDPDFLITIWDWKASKIMLRCKSHGQDVYNVMFSPTVEGHLTSSGAGHVKFWKMSRTFTGLKLKGELGRFGRTEISDVIGVYSMPDEKVLTGSEWGNILVWEEGLIKVEVRRKNKLPCHKNMITQFEFFNGELISVGMDGWIRFWYYDTIDQADPPEDNRFIEVEPIYEFKICKDPSYDREEDESSIGENSMLMGISKINIENLDDTFWYAQDGNGGLWMIDLDTLKSPELPKKLLTCHAGPITDMSICTWNFYVATFGKGGRLHVYNYVKKNLIVIHSFRDAGCKVIWLPCSMESSGTTLVCGFESGMIRVISVNISEAEKMANPEEYKFISLCQVVKPHTASITGMKINISERLLVTGSKDSTIFVFSIKVSEEFPTLIPIGFVRMPSGITCMTWHPKNPLIILAGCFNGECSEVEVPKEPQSYTTITYELHCRPKSFRFTSVKSKIRQDIFRLEIEKQKEKKRSIMREKMEKYIELNPGIEIDEETFLIDTEEYPPLPEIYIPEIPNPVLMVDYIKENKIWLWMGGFDAGYIYEYSNPDNEIIVDQKPLRSIPICDADDMEVHSSLFYNDTYLYLGMHNGDIRVCRINKNDPTDLSDYLILPMHDTFNGKISKLLTSHDEKMLLSCGSDRNLFSYVINEDSFPKKNGEKPTKSQKIIDKQVEDVDEKNYPSLEDVIKSKEHDRLLAVAKDKKEKTLSILKNLSEEFRVILEKNKKLYKSQQLTNKDFELDPRITEDLNNHLKAEMDLVHEKLAFGVEKSRLRLEKLMNHFIKPITCLPFAVTKISNPQFMVHSLKEKILGKDFSTTYANVIKNIEEKEKKIKSPETQSLAKKEEEEEEAKIKGIESFLKGLSSETIQHKLGVQINQMMRKYRDRKARIEQRAQEWKIMNASKPDPNAHHPDDITAIEEAKKTIGDYKLKISTNFDIDEGSRETTWTKYKQLLDCRRKTHFIREDFNDHLRTVRDKKLALQSEVKILIEKLKLIHLEIPAKYIKTFPKVPEINFDLEFPEKNLEMEKYIPMTERIKNARKQKFSIAEESLVPIDEEYQVLLLDESHLKFLEKRSDSAFLSTSRLRRSRKTQVTIPATLMESLSSSDQIETNWEREMILFRVSRKVYEQDCILRHINKSYEDIDKELDDLEAKRLKIHADSVYSELFQLTLHQEFIVLRDCEETENILTGKLEDKVKERSSSRQKLQSLSTTIEYKTREITKMHEKVRELNHQFLTIISENKYSEFLKRIFKRKYKPPKVNDNVSSDSSSSDSSSEDDDGDSDDSIDMQFIYLDENVCPVGCDEEHYDAAFTMRSKRHNLENSLRDEQKAVEMLRRDVERELKKIKFIENNLKQSEQELKDFMIEKQKKLNDIEMTVIMNFHQLQHMTDDGLAKIRDCVVFDKTTLSRLYTRVGELQQETYEQQIKHKKNLTHLHRMDIDCKHMDTEIKSLKSEIKQEMIKKFGREISLSSLYEAVLRRMVYDIKADMKELIKVYDKEIECVKEHYGQKVQVLENLILDNTEKLSFLTVLEEEHFKLGKILKSKPASEEEMTRIEQEYQEDLAKLDEILKTQKQQKDLFRADIRSLRLKSRPLPPICSKGRNLKILNSEIDDNILEIRSKTADKSNFDVTSKDKKLTDSNLMIRDLISKIINSSTKPEEIPTATQEILHEILSNLPVGENISDIQQRIKSSVDELFENQSVNNFPENIREIIMENFNEMISKLKVESKGVDEGSVQISWDLKPKIDELLDSMGIKRNVNTEIELRKYFKMENGLELAVNYLISKLPKQPDQEATTALREYAMRTLREIQQQMDESEPETEFLSSTSELEL